MYDISVMHDFFVDRILIAKDQVKLFKEIIAKSKKGGGSIRNIKQIEKPGGNAVNLARWASFLGLKTLLVTHSDKKHLGLLREATSKVSRLIVKDIEPGYTLSIESHTNVMLSDTKGASSFGPGLITDLEWEEIKRSKVICILNWSSNAQGTKLLLKAREDYHGKIFFDPADFSDKQDEFAKLLNLFSKKKVIDWFSFNQNEARNVATLLGLRGSLESICKDIADSFSAKVDIHTESFSVSSDGKETVVNIHRKLKERTMTGAGDVWNAASLYSYIMGYKDEERLRFADSVAGIFISTVSENKAQERIRLFLEHS